VERLAVGDDASAGLDEGAAEDQVPGGSISIVRLTRLLDGDLGRLSEILHAM
jgi:hypothetical protein